MTNKLLILRFGQCNYNVSSLVVVRFCSVLEKGVILCGFKATCSLVNTGLTLLVFVRLFVRWSLTLNCSPSLYPLYFQSQT